MPRAVTADRGYGQPAVERDLQALGVRTVVIPRPGQDLTRPQSNRAQAAASGGWSSGAPDPRDRISYLKRGYGWDRTRLDGRHGAAIWCGHGVFAHNLVKIGVLAS